MDPELDPELAELMRLEELERGEAGFVASHPHGAELDPDLAELMAVLEEEGAANPGGFEPNPELDPELAELMRLEAEERGEGSY